MPSRIVPSAYVFARREPGLFIEIYFPKRVVYQTEIIQALSEGIDEKRVKTYLKIHARKILAELAAYPPALDPRKYARHAMSYTPITLQDAKSRIDMYESPFFLPEREGAGTF